MIKPEAVARGAASPRTPDNQPIIGVEEGRVARRRVQAQFLPVGRAVRALGAEFNVVAEAEAAEEARNGKMDIEDSYSSED